jgi:5-deoxy-5-amino-3-dehydroquinate synthase
MAKYALLGVEHLAEVGLCEQVARCVGYKAAIVAGDERESGRRMVLNYGHTLAHALEAAGFASEEATGSFAPLCHGEAVAIGLVFAGTLAEAIGRIDQSRSAYHREVVSAYGLPSRLPAGADRNGLVEYMGRDKKSAGGLTFMLDGPNGVEPVTDVSANVVLDVLGELGGDR